MCEPKVSGMFGLFAASRDPTPAPLALGVLPRTFVHSFAAGEEPPEAPIPGFHGRPQGRKPFELADALVKGGFGAAIHGDGAARQRLLG